MHRLSDIYCSRFLISTPRLAEPNSVEQRELSRSPDQELRQVAGRIGFDRGIFKPKHAPVRVGYPSGFASALAFERRTEEITLTPDQATPAHRAEIVERNAEIRRHDIEAIQSNGGSVVCHIPDAASMNAVAAEKKHEDVPVDDRSTLRTPLEYRVARDRNWNWR